MLWNVAACPIGGGGSSIVGKQETKLYEPKESLHSFCGGIKTGLINWVVDKTAFPQKDFGSRFWLMRKAHIKM